MMKSFFENRRLRRDLRIADHNHMQLLDEISDLKKRLKEAQAKIENEQQKTQSCKKDIRELRKKVRDQSAADLLVNSLRALGVFPTPNNHTDYYAEASRLQDIHDQQIRALGNTQYEQRANQLANRPGGLLGIL